MADESRIVLNVGGRRFETHASTFASLPDSLLGTMFAERNQQMLHADTAGEWFFDRDPDAFAVILNFYRSGRLMPPSTMSAALLQAELEYFQINVRQEDEGNIYICGRGDLGQLGCGYRCPPSLFQCVTALRGVAIQQIAIGSNHVLALDQHGAVYSWGFGSEGRLGHGHEKNCLTPRRIERLHTHRITQVECGEVHSAAVGSNGELWTWGCGRNGELGINARGTYSTPQLVQLELHAYAAGPDGGLHSHTIEPTSARRRIPASEPHTESEDTSVELPTIGARGRTGQHNVVQVACGSYHTACRTDAGVVFTFGSGEDGRLGHGDEADKLVPTAALGSCNVVQVSCGGHHTAVLTAAGAVWTWGFDDDGRLGHGQPGHLFVPRQVETLRDEVITQISCGCWHSAAISSTGSLYTWGSGKSGQLGLGETTSSLVPSLVMQPAVQYQSTAKSSESEMSEPAGRDEALFRVMQVSCGTAHTAVVTSEHEVYVWGKADKGRLGVHPIARSPQPAPVAAGAPDLGPRNAVSFPLLAAARCRPRTDDSPDRSTLTGHETLRLRAGVRCVASGVYNTAIVLATDDA